MTRPIKGFRGVNAPQPITATIQPLVDGDIEVIMPADRANYVFTVKVERVPSRPTREYLAQAVAAACILLRRPEKSWTIPDINELLDAAQRLALSNELRQVIALLMPDDVITEVDIQYIETFDAAYLIGYERRPPNE